MKQFAVALFLLMVALSATAQKPTITEVPFTTFTLPASLPGFGTCGFDVLFVPQEGRPNKSKLIQFGNTTIGNGPLFLTATNLSNQKSVNLSSPAPVTFTFTGGILTSSVSRGPQLTFALPTNLLAANGLPPLPLINGRSTFTFDLQGNLISFSYVGTVTDVCKMLE